MTDRRLVPPLSPGDVYVYSHGNGAIYLLEADGRSRLVTLGEVEAITAAAHEAGARVFAAWDDTPIAAEVVERIRTGAPVVAFELGRPPHSWNDGTDALMEAASVGADRLLDDLIARGVDLARRDVSGSTALHHAAAHGNLHAIDALVAAGADLDAASDTGLTPHMVAMATRELDAARRLVDLGADPGAGQATSRTFARSHAMALYVPAALLLGLVVGGTALLWPVGPVVALFVPLAIAGALLALVGPPAAFWTAGVPRRLDGQVLTVRGLFGARRAVDLRAVTCAAIGGSTLRARAAGSRWLVLAHPEGRVVTRRTLRRLRVPAEELDVLAPRFDRAVVVPLDAARRDEVIVAVGNLLSGRGVDLSPSLRQQLAEARRSARPSSGRAD